jgi:hypothetical protein
MRRAILITLAGAILAATGWAARAATITQSARPTAAARQHTRPDRPRHQRQPHAGNAAGQIPPRHGQVRHQHAAEADGYQIITRVIPDMGWHFLNPDIQGFDVTKPAILVYERHGRSWQLGALSGSSPRPRPARPCRGDLRVVRRRLPLQGRHLRVRPRPAVVRQAQPADRCAVQLLAPGPGHPARVAVVSQPSRPLQRHQPLCPTFQPQLAHPSITRPGAEPARTWIPASIMRRSTATGRRGKC